MSKNTVKKSAENVVAVVVLSYAIVGLTDLAIDTTKAGVRKFKNRKSNA